MNKTTGRIHIRNTYTLEGPLYRVMGEDEELFVFDTTFRAVALDGRVFEHRTHAVRGAVKNPEGFMVPNYNYKNERERFCQRVEERGSIDASLWDEVTEVGFDLQAALAEEAARERAERREATGRWV